MNESKIDKVLEDTAVIKNIMARLEPLVDKHEKYVNGGLGIVFFCTIISAIIMFLGNIKQVLGI